MQVFVSCRSALSAYWEIKVRINAIKKGTGCESPTVSQLWVPLCLSSYATTAVGSAGRCLRAERSQKTCLMFKPKSVIGSWSDCTLMSGRPKSMWNKHFFRYYVLMTVGVKAAVSRCKGWRRNWVLLSRCHCLCRRPFAPWRRWACGGSAAGIGGGPCFGACCVRTSLKVVI